MNWMTPTDCINVFREKRKPFDRLAFISAFVAAFLTHLYLFMRRNINEDNLGYISFKEDHTAIGRWSEQLLISFRTSYLLPAAIGIICFALIALTAVLTVRILKLHTPLFILLSSLLIAVFPALAYSFSYLFMAHTYCTALFLAALSVYITQKYRYGALAGGIILGFSIGCYQSYLGYAATLCILLLVCELIQEQLDIVSFIKRIFRYIMLGVTGMALYLTGLKLSLYIKQIEMASYKGMNQIGSYPISKIFALVRKTYQRFFGFFTGSTSYFFSVSEFWETVYIIVLIALGCLLLLSGISLWKVRHTRNSVLLAALLILLLPATINMVDLLAPQASSRTINIYQMVLLFIFPLAVLDADETKGTSKWERIAWMGGNWVITAGCSLLIFNYFIMSNTYSLKLDVYTQRTILLNNRVLSRIEHLPGYTLKTPVAILARYDAQPYGIRSDSFPDIRDGKSDQGLWGQFIGYNYAGDKMTLGSQNFSRIVNGVFGVPVTCASAEQIEKVQNSEEYRQMPIWPQAGSVAMIEGVAVVNFTLPVQIDEKIDTKNHTITWELQEWPALEDCQYRWNVFHNGHRIQSFGYGEMGRTLIYSYPEEGTYFVRLFVQRKDGSPVLEKTTEAVQVLNGHA